MHRCLHQRRHKHSPDQNVGFVLGSKEVVHLLQDSPFLDILDDFLQVPWVGDLHIAISSFGISKKLTSLLRRQLPAAGWAGGSSLRTLFLVCVWNLSIALLPVENTLSVHRWWTSHTVCSCVLRHHTGPHFDSPRLLGSLNSCEGTFLMLERFKFTRFGFATADVSAKSLSELFLSWCTGSWLNQTKHCWNGCRKH